MQKFFSLTASRRRRRIQRASAYAYGSPLNDLCQLTYAPTRNRIAMDTKRLRSGNCHRKKYGFRFERWPPPQIVAQSGWIRTCCPGTMFRTAAELSGAPFHRAGHVTNVPHARKTTVISPAILSGIQWTEGSRTNRDRRMRGEANYRLAKDS